MLYLANAFESLRNAAKLSLKHTSHSSRAQSSPLTPKPRSCRTKHCFRYGSRCCRRVGFSQFKLSLKDVGGHGRGPRVALVGPSFVAGVEGVCVGVERHVGRLPIDDPADHPLQRGVLQLCRQPDVRKHLQRGRNGSLIGDDVMMDRSLILFVEGQKRETKSLTYRVLEKLLRLAQQT